MLREPGRMAARVCGRQLITFVVLLESKYTFEWCSIRVRMIPCVGSMIDNRHRPGVMFRR
jgi:hypothetical protein